MNRLDCIIQYMGSYLATELTRIHISNYKNTDILLLTYIRYFCISSDNTHPHKHTSTADCHSPSLLQRQQPYWMMRDIIWTSESMITQSLQR
jgi:hypothetical protein